MVLCERGLERNALRKSKLPKKGAHQQLWGLGMQIRSEFNLNSPNSLRIRSHCEFAANSA